MALAADAPKEFLFTENETNNERLFQAASASPYVKDGVGRYLIGRESGAVNPALSGTKAALHYESFAAGETWTVRLRLAKDAEVPDAEFDRVFAQRQAEADAFYATVQPESLAGTP